MNYYLSACTYCLILVSLATTTLASSNANFLVIDVNNQPVADAVISAKQDSPPANAVLNQDVAVMDQINRTFQPFVIDIDAGQQVSFPNSDNIRHHVYSFSPAKAFELKLYSGIPEAPLTFAEPGIVVLGCNIHDSMVGYIYVSASPHHTKSDTEGKAILNLPNNNKLIYIWHPSFSLDGQKQLTLAINDLPIRAIEGTDYHIIQLDNGIKSPATSGKTSFKSTSKFKSSQ